MGKYDPMKTVRTGEYNLVLTNAAFLHRKYLEAYTNRMPRAMRDMVDAKMNCDDIAMNFLVANISAKSPIRTQKLMGPSIPAAKRWESAQVCLRVLSI